MQTIAITIKVVVLATTFLAMHGPTRAGWAPNAEKVVSKSKREPAVPTVGPAKLSRANVPAGTASQDPDEIPPEFWQKLALSPKFRELERRIKSLPEKEQDEIALVLRTKMEEFCGGKPFKEASRLAFAVLFNSGLSFEKIAEVFPRFDETVFVRLAIAFLTEQVDVKTGASASPVSISEFGRSKPEDLLKDLTPDLLAVISDPEMRDAAAKLIPNAPALATKLEDTFAALKPLADAVKAEEEDPQHIKDALTMKEWAERRTQYRDHDRKVIADLWARSTRPGLIAPKDNTADCFIKECETPSILYPYFYVDGQAEMVPYLDLRQFVVARTAHLGFLAPIIAMGQTEAEQYAVKAWENAYFPQLFRDTPVCPSSSRGRFDQRFRNCAPNKALGIPMDAPPEFNCERVEGKGNCYQSPEMPGFWMAKTCKPGYYYFTWDLPTKREESTLQPKDVLTAIAAFPGHHMFAVCKGDRKDLEPIFGQRGLAKIAPLPPIDEPGNSHPR